VQNLAANFGKRGFQENLYNLSDLHIQKDMAGMYRAAILVKPKAGTSLAGYT